LTYKTNLSTWLEDFERLVIMGIGNPLRRDDAIGIEIVKLLKSQVPESVKLIECEILPENYLEEIKDFGPTYVLLIDAAYLEAKPGHAQVITLEEISGTAVSTHSMPLSLFIGLLKNIKVEVMLLGVQPESTEFGEELSPKLQKAALKIATLIAEAISFKRKI
jgi:hydrogenase 3 maturation protease